MPEELEPALRVKPGSHIKQGELLAEHRSFFGLSRATIEAPIDGTLESVSFVTGQAMLREPPEHVEISAYIDGIVVEEIPHEGVIVEAEAALIQGIFGLAGEVHAPLTLVAERPDQTLRATDLDPSHEGKIVIGGGQITLDAMKHATELGVAGVVVGGFAYQDVKELLGYDVGVAVTGNEPISTTLIVTEGFGDISMAKATYELLASHDGAKASINGATQIRAGVIRPEVVIPHGRPVDEVPEHESLGLEVGAPVRCIRAPYFGKIGKVKDLPVELQVMASETKVRVLEVAFENGDTAILPRANVEVIER